MKKIIVVGSGGAGKSTFSKRLSGTLDIDVIHLDRLYWRPHWQEVPQDEWHAIVEELISRHSWIMDGNYGATREMRIRACDTIIFLDIPRRVCLYRIVKRALIYHGGKTGPIWPRDVMSVLIWSLLFGSGIIQNEISRGS